MSSVKHGFRVATPAPSVLLSHSVTGLEHDVPLTSFGQTQVKELCEYIVLTQDKLDRIYSSPFYRTMQTANIIASHPAIDLPIYVESGIGEWYGKTTRHHPKWLAARELAKWFPRVKIDYESLLKQNRKGETMIDIQNRAKEYLRRLMNDTNMGNDGPRTVLLITHAATNITLGRALTHDPDCEIRTGTCSLGKYVLKEWDGDYGKWECKINGDCSFLTGGEQRNWEFDGDIPVEVVDETTFSKL